MSVEIVPSAEEILVGEAAVFDVRMTNHDERPLTVWHSTDLMGFTVSDDDSNPIWSTVPIVTSLETFDLQSGNSLLLSELREISPTEWDARRDSEGFPVPPGNYWVQGIIRAELPPSKELPSGSDEVIKTEPQWLTVHASPLPDFAEAIDLELNVPATVEAATTLSADMAVTNTGEQPVTLHLGGTFLAPDGTYFGTGTGYANYLDVVVFRNGKVLWRAAPAHGLNGNSGRVHLGPGESKTLGELFGGDPWSWDQHDPDGTPAPPGDYMVRGVVTVSVEGEPLETIATEPHELRILD